MDCRKVKRYLGMYLDSELGPETTFEISSHLEECADCQRVAEQEECLENRLRSVLCAPCPEDEANWSRSVARLRHSRAGTRTPVVRIGIAGLAIAATIALFVLLGAPRIHDELDLAEATAEAHSHLLNRRGTLLSPVQDLGKISEYFQRELSPSYCLDVDTTGGMRLIGGILCELADIPAAHLVCEDSQVTVSLFWLPTETLESFPETVARFEESGPSFHCRVAPYEFFAKKSGTGIIVGIAKTTPALLEVYVGGAAMGICQDGL